jgi:phosphoribosylformylglycinamidine cyclo-ligase
VAEGRSAYAAAGVDVAAGDRAVELMRAAVGRTHRPEVLAGLGGFGAAVLVSSTDGVGTKTAIAAALARYDTIGRDLVAMCADDVVCSGAAPLFFLDYVAVGRLQPEQVADLVEGVAAGCVDAGCALVGGETAEHPGLMQPGEFDLAGFCVGVVDREDWLDGRAAVAGDAIIGLASSGLHANGYSLVRSQIAKWDLDLARPYQEQLMLTLGREAATREISAEPEHALATLGEVLLTPTTVYAGALLRVRATLRAAGHDLRALAHITGGGLLGNVPRAIPAPLAARLDPETWRMPSIVRLFGALGGLDDVELRATFNGGLGMIVVVGPEAVAEALAALAEEGMSATVVGEVVPGDGGSRYVEGALPR